MKTGSITFKLLAWVVVAFVTTTASVLMVADHKLIEIIDHSQNAMYTEKVDVIWSELNQTEERLQKTGLVDAYIEGFQNTAIDKLRRGYYTSPEQPIYPFVLDLEGRVVMHPVLPAGDWSLKNHEGMKRQAQAKAGNFTSRHNGREKWYVYRTFDQWNWVVGYVVPLDVKYADIRSFRISLLVIMTCISLLILLILTLILARFTKPIVKLTELASEIAGGNLDREIDLGGNDEIGMLARSFDNMRGAVKQQLTNLNHEIEVRKQAEISLLRNEENLRITLDSIGDAVVATDMNGRIVRMNPVAERLSGRAFSEAEGKPLSDILKIVQARSRKPIHYPVKKAFSNTRFLGGPEASMLISRDGTEYLIADSGAPIRSGTGEMLGMVMVFRDITKESALQEHLKQSQKMDAIGQLAGGVAHDFNNMLGGILGAAEVIGEFLPDDPVVKRFYSIITESVGRAAGLTQKLLSFARKQPYATTVIDAHQPLNDALELLNRTMDRRISVVTELTAETSKVVGDPSQLQNAFLNLGINASHAMPEGGTITIRSRNVHMDEAQCESSHFEITPGSYLEIEVCDTGNGIDPKDLPHIFEPFFTTKEHGKGTGLGLAAVFGTVQQHKGVITVSNQAAGGARFRLLLPIASESAPLSDQAPAAKKITGHGTILVVDDEEVLRRITQAILQELGYTVMLAENGKQALDLFATDPKAIDLVMIDMIMPEMNGRDCFEALQKIDPDVRAILVSGYAQEEDVQQMMSAGLKGCLFKPYRRADLSKLLQTALR